MRSLLPNKGIFGWKTVRCINLGFLDFLEEQELVVLKTSDHT